MKIAADVYEVGWKIFGYDERGNTVLLSEDVTRGSRKDFEEAMRYLQNELLAGTTDTPQEVDIPKTTQDSEWNEGHQEPPEEAILAYYQAILPQYLAKKAQDLEEWDRSHGAQNTYFFEVIHAGTPVGNKRFHVAFRILVRLQTGEVVSVSSVDAEVHAGELEALTRQMLEFLGEKSTDQLPSKYVEASPVPREDTMKKTPETGPPQTNLVAPEENNTEIVSLFRDFYPRYLSWLAEQETTRVREVFGYDDDIYWVEIIDNAREVAPGTFRLHYQSYVRHRGETKLYNETKLDLTVEGLQRLLEEARQNLPR